MGIKQFDDRCLVTIWIPIYTHVIFALIIEIDPRFPAIKRINED